MSQHAQYAKLKQRNEVQPSFVLLFPPVLLLCDMSRCLLPRSLIKINWQSWWIEDTFSTFITITYMYFHYHCNLYILWFWSVMCTRLSVLGEGCGFCGSSIFFPDKEFFVSFFLTQAESKERGCHKLYRTKPIKALGCVILDEINKIDLTETFRETYCFLFVWFNL